MTFNPGLVIVGGTYVESCIEPNYYELFGSGLRAACGLADKGFNITFHTCVGPVDLSILQRRASTFGFIINPTVVGQTVEFSYYHPLSKPIAFSSIIELPPIQTPDVVSTNILYYGMAEARTAIHGEYVVYDPQNSVPFHQTKSTATHLALVLNRNEAYTLAGLGEETDLAIVGTHLLNQEKAEAVIIKDGAKGGFVITKKTSFTFPVYATETVWPIGSGDAFSAVFAWKWMIERLEIVEAVDFASQYAAEYCETQILPFPNSPARRQRIDSRKSSKKVYLAGPFFTSAERWLIHELRVTLKSFGAQVFSPYHDVGFIDGFEQIEFKKNVAQRDLKELDDADVVLAVLNGGDTGTTFEIGYALAQGKKVVILVENINPNDLVMIEGAGCIITSDIPTAIYKATW